MVTGRRRSIASKTRPDQSAIRVSRHVIAIPYTMYEFIIALINANAAGLLYISAVGAGNMCSAPNIGMIIRSDKMTFRIMCVYFFI
jgi:hypothetical protein